MRDWRIACGGGFLAALALAALAAPWLPLRDPLAQPDTGGLRELPPLARPYVLDLRDGGSRYGRDVRRADDGSIELLRASGWQRVAAEELAGAPHRVVYLLGTDGFGRDLLARLIHGARASLAVGLLAALIALAIGTTLGAAAGLAGGWLDALLMRFVDLALSVPRLFAALLLVSLFHVSLATTIVVLGATSWMVAARLVRGEFLSLRERDFVQAARAAGAPFLRLGLRHVLPSAAGPVLVEAALRVGDTILLEAALSFLGLGVQPPAPSWGNMVADGRGLLESAWWISTVPGLAIGLTVLALNLLADSARERLSARRGAPDDRLVRASGRTYIPPPVRAAAAVRPLSRMVQAMTNHEVRYRNDERGEGRVGFVITLIVIAVAVFVGIKVIPVRVAAYEFHDVLREEARYGAVRDSDALVFKRILEKAAELEVPLEKDRLSVKRTESQMIITASYEQPIDLKVTTYVYRFNATEKAPLF